MMRELAELFFQEAPALVGRIRDAVSAGDVAGLRHAAHTLKGAAAVFGPNGAAEVARRLEQRAREDALEGAAHDVALLETEIDRLLGGLRASLSFQQTAENPTICGNKTRTAAEQLRSNRRRVLREVQRPTSKYTPR
jgi:HPt (histidine-containing phosphotransfer) domain-containing protein